jgi:hypothetical protein
MFVVVGCALARPVWAADATVDGTRRNDWRLTSLPAHVALSFAAADRVVSPAERFPSLRFGDSLSEAIAPVSYASDREYRGGLAMDAAVDQSARTKAFQYSDGYQTRAHIHKLASYAMLPLFGIEAYLGQKMFNNAANITTGERTAHKYVGMGIGALFVVNTVTGVMNLSEVKQDPNAGTRPLIHGVLMLVADCGFLATAMLRPNSLTTNGIAIYEPKKNQHMTIAYASISVATVSYLMMIFK